MSNSMGDKVLKAFQLAERVHIDQKRKSGEPYITHPVAVAKMLFDNGADRDTICAALLHDSLEDSGEKYPWLEGHILREFGDHVLYMVQALSKDNAITDKLAQQSKYLEQIEQAFEVDINIFFIKIADQLHNISTISALASERKERWITELKHEYLPLFSEYYHRVPLPYRNLHQQMMQDIQNLIESHEESSK